MHIGIDVGGTCTDAVLLDQCRVKAMAKVATKENLLDSLTEALDTLLKGVSPDDIDRVVFSTTMITNLIAEKKYDAVALVLMPGPGRSLSQYRFQADTFLVSGAIDYRGREIIPLDEQEVLAVIGKLEAGDYGKIAVVGKFSTRNNKHEQKIFNLLKQAHPDWQIEMGHQAGGQLNFPRRVANTLLNCATKEKYHFFVNSVQDALTGRGIKGTSYILKADGGTLPLVSSELVPVETIFSGPAASTLGVQSLTRPGETSLVVDIGGTTTDLALVLSGKPLLSSRGAKIGDQLTQVRALAVKSVPVGGDSVLERMGHELIIYSERMGPAYCLGGPLPTPTDALRVLGLTEIGDAARAGAAMQLLADPVGKEISAVAHEVVELVVQTITAEIEKMFLEWEAEPAYRVWEVVQKRRVRPNNIVGVGGGAAGFISLIAAALGCRPVIPPYAPVANAIGAAVAKPTIQVNLHADTEQDLYIIEEEGYQGYIEGNFDLNIALQLAKEWLVKRGVKLGLKNQVLAQELEVTRQEVFNMVRNYRTTGRLYDISIQTPRGIMGHIGSGEGLI